MHSQTSTTFTHQVDILETVAKILAKYQDSDYYVYEREQHWYMGIGNQSSLIIDSKGETATINTESSETSRTVAGDSIAGIAREFVSENTKHGYRVFGQAGFNYAAHVRGQSFNPGCWPLLALFVPRTELVLEPHTVTINGVHEEVRDLYDLIHQNTMSLDVSLSPKVEPIDTLDTQGIYQDRVKRALADIAEGQYVKVIPSRALEVGQRINMPATLLSGRRSNNPARTFCLNHAGYEATGFSPELVMSMEDGKVMTEPLAGTRSRKGTPETVELLRQELLNDPKEIVEHVLSVKEAITELHRLCPPETVNVEDLMSIRERGSVQHLGSSVAGILSPEKDMWDAFDVLFPSITASGIPKDAALEAIQRLEDQPRELYSGAVLMIEGPRSVEAALVLRTVFQDQSRGWVQAGAGVISQSNPERELTETREKLASIAPFVIQNV
ncbi:uncharacterized protein N7511_003651 [Penicillium nucicola]|uniref:uncharacterized protein n=1 Tax=Penicillium nucicola TaxID=1850975 RepID=UPI002545B18C|nr:uncharacterized protein N7511_003651 [Penicillium nucicola]KAJ5766035.1 hypothetical protein N7511_003651 [Penicillium nucicola]